MRGLIMIRRIIALSVFLVALAASPARSVSLNPRGTGQVLLYPYYTVNGGNMTLLTVGNSTAKGKALKIRFREAYNGRDVMDFNIFLAPFDMWTAAVFQLSAAGPANLVTDDNSCTVPAIKNGTAAVLGTLPDGRRYVPFGIGLFTGSVADSGPTDLTRTREGFFEVIEMSEVTDGTLQSLHAITHRNDTGVPNNCAQLAGQSPTADMAIPGGGLFGTVAIVNVAQGTMASYNADALDGFSDRIQSTSAGSLHPTLADAVTDSSAGIASAYVSVGNSMLRADYPSPTRAIDAVSAVLSRQSILNEFVELQGGASQSEWVVTFPTKHFYVDPALATTAIAPFPEIFGDVDDGQSCARIDGQIYNRESRSPTVLMITPLPPAPRYRGLCFETQVLTFTSAFDEPLRKPSPFLGSRLTYNFDGPLYVGETGWLRVDLDSAQEPHRLRAANGGEVFIGLPTLGFLLTNYVNNNVQPGVLANYSGTFPHRSNVACIRNNGPCQ
jgi:hypothetical protein